MHILVTGGATFVSDVSCIHDNPSLFAREKLKVIERRAQTNDIPCGAFD